MCRNIKTLFNFHPPVTDEETRAAALQFVRKITGFNKPSKANEALFLSAVDESQAFQFDCCDLSRRTRPQRTAKKRRPRQRHGR